LSFISFPYLELFSMQEHLIIYDDSIDKTKPIWTNNDLEGWHNALNRRAGQQSSLPLYLLIELLDREAKLTAVTIRLVSDNKLKQIQCSVTRNIQAKLFASWEKYENNEKTAAQLLKTCSRLNGPARVN